MNTPISPNASRRSVLGGLLATTAVTTGAILSSGSSAEAAVTDLTKKTGVAPPRPAGQKTMIGVPFAKRDAVRIGLIGLGNRGQSMCSGWSAIPGAQIIAVCDIRTDRANRVADTIANFGHTRPVAYGGAADSYKQMLAAHKLDLVYIATPWEFHFEQGRDAMLSGANACVELPVALELKDLWSLVNTSERTRKHLMLAENCSYGRNELAMLRMAHAGVFGDITSGAGGYLHDLRALLFDPNYYTDSWRRKWHTRSTASFYPMHGLAPIAAAMDINRGDRFATLAASATPAKGLAEYRKRHVPPNDPSWSETYINGDSITCIISTKKGRVIRAEHAVSSPRPYSRINSLIGSLGIMEDYEPRVYFEPEDSGDTWRDFAPRLEAYDHWLWKKVGADAEANGGHGGMDYIMQWRVIQQIRLGQVPDIDVYDAAAWCAPVPLSAASLAAGGAPVDVPDFTRGDWSKPRAGLNSTSVDMPPWTVPVPPAVELTAAFNNVGTTSLATLAQGNYDFEGNSFSATALAAVGIKPGGTVTALGTSFTWPNVVDGAKNNACGAQHILFTGAGTSLAFLGAGVGGDGASGTVTVHYTDGTTSQAPLGFPNWLTSTPDSFGATLVASSKGRNTPTGFANETSSYNVYANQIPLAAGKTVKSVLLPPVPGVHVFALSVIK